MGENRSSRNPEIEKIDATKLESIVKNMVQTVEQAREDIYQISDDARQELVRLSNELAELKQETATTISLVEALEREEKRARVRLMEVSRNFDAYKEENIKEAYDVAYQLQIQLSTLREKEKHLVRRRNDLERSFRRVEQMAKRAEDMVDRVSMVTKVLKGNIEAFAYQLEDAQKKQNMGMWIIQAQEEERRRVARELHDGPAQSLANLVMRLDLIERLWETDRERVKQEFAIFKLLVRDNITEIRRVIFDLRPMALDDLGLVPALKRYLTDYQDKYGLQIDFRFFGTEQRLQLPMEVALFRLMQEALTNVRKHAGVKQVSVKLEMGSGLVTMIVKDQGVGFDINNLSDATDSYGLMGMKERVEYYGGEFIINSRPNQGTQITIRVPFEEGEEK